MSPQATSHANGKDAGHKKHAAPAAISDTPRKQRRKRRRDNAVGRVIATGAFVLVGTVLILGVASLAALAAGYEPPGFEKEARGVRRYALEHKPDFSRAADVLEPVSRQIGRGERWVREKVRSARG
jgi:hypothetical protein